MDKNRVKLTVLLLMTALPIVLATLAFYLREGQGIGVTTNRGTLISPVMDVTELGMMESGGDPLFLRFEEEVANIDPSDYQPRPWILVYMGGPACDAACEERLFLLRQVHVRLGADSARVSRLYLVANAEPGVLTPATRTMIAGRFPELRLAWADPGLLRNNLARITPADKHPIDDHFIFVVDPVGNVMLYFTPDNAPEDILSDLETLLDQTSLG